MSWKIYALGSAKTAKDTAVLVGNKLKELGYNVSSTGGSDYEGYFYITINDVQYTHSLRIKETNTVPVFLCVNAETNSILVCRYDSVLTADTTCNAASYMLLHGIDAVTGNPGMFFIKDSRYGTALITNYWYPTVGTDTMFLHRAVFRKNGTYNDYDFVTDDLYWGSINLTPGAVITVGTESFVCLNYNLYAKL